MNINNLYMSLITPPNHINRILEWNNYMNIVAEFNPTLTTSGNFVAYTQDGSSLLVINESYSNLTLHFPNGATAYIPANDRRIFGLFGPMSQPNSFYTWETQSNLGTANEVNQVIVESYDPGEQISETYPSPLIRQTNVGNSIPVSTSTNQLVNTGNAPLSNIITAKPSDATSNTWTADNSGNLSISSDNAGTLTTLLQLIAGATPAVKLAAASIIAEVLGNLKVDGTIESVGSVTLDNAQSINFKDNLGASQATLWVDSSNNTNIGSAATGGPVYIKDESGAIIGAFENQIGSAVTIGGNGGLSISKVFFNIGAIKDINKGNFSASGTINHGLSGTPTNVLLCPALSGSTWTFSAASYTTTQFTATINSANSTNFTAYR